MMNYECLIGEKEGLAGTNVERLIEQKTYVLKTRRETDREFNIHHSTLKITN